MAEYRFLACDLKTGSIREEIPFASFSFGEVENRAGEWSGALPVNHPKAGVLEPSRTEVVVERGGIPIWSGVLWPRTKSIGGPDFEYRGNGLWDIFNRRHVRGRLPGASVTNRYDQVDQLQIVRHLIDYTQGQPGGDIRLQTGAELSGRLRDEEYPAHERKNIAEAVEQMAARRDGFDFSIGYAWDTSDPADPKLERTLRLHYPRRGRRTGLVFELGANVDDWGEAWDGTRHANLVDAIGQGEGDAMLIATAVDPNQWSTYPLLEEITNHKTVKLLPTLRDHAAAEMDEIRQPVRLLQLQVSPEAKEAPFGSWVVGDEVTVRIRDGEWIRESDGQRFYNVDLDLPQRIVAWTVSVQGAREDITTTTGPLGQD